MNGYHEWKKIEDTRRSQESIASVGPNNKLGKELVRQRVEVVTVKLGVRAGAKVRLCDRC